MISVYILSKYDGKNVFFEINDQDFQEQITRMIK